MRTLRAALHPGAVSSSWRTTFTSDGASSAWALFAAAHPGYKVLDAYLVMDEDGTAFVDRLAFHNRMFQSSGSGTAAVKACGSEAVC